ncbi:MAG: nitrous oxide reductase family maturation protein NosD [Candidatus Kapaibacterium sp.]|nr:nitrous oxide reductase family maturation protein NosD [Candidatus Kapabacteria bacterium]
MIKISFILLLFSCMNLSASVTEIDDISGYDIKNILNKLNPHDTLIIHSGEIHDESIVIKKPLTLIGKNNPIINGKGGDHIIKIFADSVEINGFTIQNSGFSHVQDRSGIRTDSIKHCKIVNNIFNNTMFAFYAARSSDLTISDNIFLGKGKRESASGNAVHLWYCKTAKVTNNRLEGHRDGIYLEFTENVVINNNHTENNIRYGLHFMFSHNAEYKNNIFRNNGSGVAVMYTRNVLMENNVFELNQGAASYGLLLKDIKDSKIINNKLVNNSTGIYIEGGGKNELRGNLIKSNAWAVRILASSTNNVFTGNSIMGNSFDLSTNSTMSQNEFEGNYWDKYRGYDLDRDGKGDIPYYPVRLFAFIVEKNPPLIILLNSFFIFILDLAENLIPSITPAAMIDNSPLMTPQYDKI